MGKSRRGNVQISATHLIDGQDFGWGEWGDWSEGVEFIPDGLPVGVYDSINFRNGTGEHVWEIIDEHDAATPMGREVWGGIIPLNTDNDNHSVPPVPDLEKKQVDGENDLVPMEAFVSVCWNQECDYILGTVDFTVIEGGQKINVWCDYDKAQEGSISEANTVLAMGALVLEGEKESLAIGDVAIEEKYRDEAATNCFSVMRLDVFGDIDHNDRIEPADMVAAQAQGIPGLLIGCGQNNRTKIELNVACKLPSGAITLSVTGAGGLKLWQPGVSGQPYLEPGNSRTWQVSEFSSIPRYLYVEGLNAGNAEITLAYADTPSNPKTYFRSTLSVTVLKVDIAVDLEDQEVNGVRSGLKQDTLKFDLNGNVIPNSSLTLIPTTVMVDGEVITNKLKVTYVPSLSELNRPGSNTVKVDIDDMVENHMDQLVNTFQLP